MSKQPCNSCYNYLFVTVDSEIIHSANHLGNQVLTDVLKIYGENDDCQSKIQFEIIYNKNKGWINMPVIKVTIYEKIMRPGTKCSLLNYYL